MSQAAMEFPEPSVDLMDLPANCLIHILRFLDGPARQQVFRASKGAAAVVLAACESCKLRRSYSSRAKPEKDPSLMLLWAAQLGSPMELLILGGNHEMGELLSSILTIDRYRGTPATYPGITSLSFWGVKSTCLLPAVLSSAFPNLRSLKLNAWNASLASQLQEPIPCPVLGITHLSLTLGSLPRRNTPALLQLITAQLHSLRSLTSLEVDASVLEAAPPVHSLTSLVVHMDCDLSIKQQAALTGCDKLRRIGLSGASAWCVSILSHVPFVHEIEFNIANLTDDLVTLLLTLPNLQVVKAFSIASLSTDFSTAACAWRCLRFTSSCLSHVAMLPLHTLDAPITCNHFVLRPSDEHASDMARVRAATPHLRACGGIKTLEAFLSFDNRDSPGITQAQAGALLHAWAPCLSAPPRRVAACSHDVRVLIQEAVAQLWPDALQSQTE